MWYICWSGWGENMASNASPLCSAGPRPSIPQPKHCWGPGGSSLDLTKSVVKKAMKEILMLHLSNKTTFYVVQSCLSKGVILLVLFFESHFWLRLFTLIQHSWNVWAAIQAIKLQMGTNALCLYVCEGYRLCLGFELFDCQDWQS